jgi:hypothetical protein
LFQARYKAILVEDGEYLLECSRYIHLNPNRKKLTRPAELWSWSSYRNYVGGPQTVDWVRTERVMAHFGSPEDHRAYVESGRDEEPISPFERATAGLVLGSPVSSSQSGLKLESKGRVAQMVFSGCRPTRLAPLPSSSIRFG